MCVSDFSPKGSIVQDCSVDTKQDFLMMVGKAVKILFLLNRQSKKLPTCTDLSIGSRAWHGSKTTFKIP